MATVLLGTDHQFKQDVVEAQIPSLIEFAKCLGAYRAIYQDIGKISQNKQFWIQTADSNFMRAVTVWCKLFGTDDNYIHWKNASASNSELFVAAVRAEITSAGGFNDTQWADYHAEVRHFRNTYVCHRELIATGSVPHMTSALEIAKAYFRWILKQIPGENQPKQLGEWYLEAQIETLAVLSRDWGSE